MAKKLIAVRLPQKLAEDLKIFALEDKKSQAEIVAESIGLYRMQKLYIKKMEEPVEEKAIQK